MIRGVPKSVKAAISTRYPTVSSAGVAMGSETCRYARRRLAPTLIAASSSEGSMVENAS